MHSRGSAGPGCERILAEVTGATGCLCRLPSGVGGGCAPEAEWEGPPGSEARTGIDVRSLGCRGGHEAGHRVNTGTKGEGVLCWAGTEDTEDSHQLSPGSLEQQWDWDWSHLGRGAGFEGGERSWGWSPQQPRSYKEGTDPRATLSLRTRLTCRWPLTDFAGALILP